MLCFSSSSEDSVCSSAMRCCWAYCESLWAFSDSSRWASAASFFAWMVALDLATARSDPRQTAVRPRWVKARDIRRAPQMRGIVALNRGLHHWSLCRRAGAFDGLTNDSERGSKDVGERKVVEGVPALRPMACTALLQPTGPISLLLSGDGPWAACFAGC